MQFSTCLNSIFLIKTTKSPTQNLTIRPTRRHPLYRLNASQGSGNATINLKRRRRNLLGLQRRRNLLRLRKTTAKRHQRPKTRRIPKNNLQNSFCSLVNPALRSLDTRLIDLLGNLRYTTTKEQIAQHFSACSACHFLS